MSHYKIQLRNCEHGENLPKSLWKFCNEESFCDVTIIVNKDRFSAHKVVLSANSEYFHTMFTSGFKESTASEITIEGDCKIFAKLLKFAYMGKMDAVMEDLPFILVMASYFQFKSAMRACENYLLMCYDREGYVVPLPTALEINKNALVHGFTHLAEKNSQYITQNIKKFLVDPVFEERCPIDLLMSCIRSNLERTFRRCSETQVLQTVTKWLNHSWEDRKEHALNLLKMLRLGLADITVVRTLLNDDKMMCMRECKELIENILEVYDTKKTSGVPLHISHPEMFAVRNTVTALVTVATKNLHKLVFYDNQNIEERPQAAWRTYKKAPRLPCSKNDTKCQEDTHSLVVVNGRLYAAGDNSFFCLDYEADQWKPLAPMNSPVEECHLVELNGYIYAVKYGRNLERYNLEENTWEVLPSRSNSGRLTHLSVIGFDGKLFLYGRYYLHAIQVYDPDVNKWYAVPLPPHNKGYKGSPILTVHEGALYRVAYDNQRHPVVNRLQYMHNDQEGTPSIIMAELQEQKSIPGNKLEAFCIGQEVFINVRGRAVAIGRNEGKLSALLYNWRSVIKTKVFVKNPQNLAGKQLAMFTFEKKN